MNTATISTSEGTEPPLCIEHLEEAALEIMAALGLDNWDLSLLITNDETIRAYNREYRHIDAPTDVLSFELGELLPDGRFLPGDILISLESLQANADYFKVDANEELHRLLVHGILHLSGLDHATNEAAEPMLQRQEELMTQLGYKTNNLEVVKNYGL
jgi:probable rRNA maturation factor